MVESRHHHNIVNAENNINLWPISKRESNTLRRTITTILVINNNKISGVRLSTNI